MLIDIAQALDRFGSFAYVRPYAEMNGHWNPYCAYNSNGSYRGAAHSTKNFRQAFRRTYLIVHGGSVADINAKLVDSGMPKLDRTNDLPLNDVKVIWNPQGFGSPDLKANSADAYYPGDKYVDVVAQRPLRLRARRANGRRTSTSTAAHPDKPYAIGEWGLGPGNRPPASSSRRWPTSSTTTRGSRRSSTTAARVGSTSTSATSRSLRAAYKRYILPLG